MSDADDIDRVSPERHRNPRYHVFEQGTTMIQPPGGCPIDTPEEVVNVWVPIGWNIAGATDRKAITAVIGTPENPVDGFDAERRLLPHAAVLVAQWHERKLTPTKTEPTAEERAELLRQRDVIERRLAGTVVEEWDA